MSDKPPTIRSFRAKDLETLCRIDRICFPEDIAFSRTELAFYLKDTKSIARVANEAGRILGFVLAHIESPSHAHVLTLDVIPEERRRGIGTLLMDALHLRLKMKGIGAAFLEVEASNVPAQRLYEKLQYRYFGSMRGYYHGRDDAYRMVRAICFEKSDRRFQP
jgi:ribosomal-protein-alanine N-acetyltransferase